MTKSNLRGLALAAAMFLAAGAPAHAIPMTWTLSGVTFTDGTSATGSFVYDAVTRMGSNYNVSTRQGTLSAHTYDAANSRFFSGLGAGPNNFILLTNDDRRYFNFSFLTPLTDAGGTQALNTANSYECMNCNPFRFVAAGSVTTLAPTGVSEPGSAALLLAGLGVMGFIGRRRKQAA